DFYNQPALRFQLSQRLGNKERNHLNAGWSGEDRVSRFEFPNLELHLILFRFAYVRRIRNYAVELSIDACQQIRVVKLNAMAHLQSRSVSFSNFQRSGRDFSCVDFCAGQFLGEGESNTTGASTDVHNSRIAQIARKRQHSLDQMFGFGSWDQYCWRDNQIHAPKFLMTR